MVSMKSVQFKKKTGIFQTWVGLGMGWLEVPFFSVRLLWVFFSVIDNIFYSLSKHSIHSGDLNII